MTPSRAAAFDILLRVDREDSYASELLHSRAVDRLSPQDRGLCMEIVMGVLRWRSRLDAAIAQYSFTPFPRLDFEILTALRIGAYQLMYLGGIPNRAAVNKSVMLAKLAKKKSAAALVNVILRKIAASKSNSKAAVPQELTAPSLARAYSHPEWLVERWIREYGPETAVKICAFDQLVPTTAVRVRTGDPSIQDVVLTPGKLLRSARLVQSGDVAHAQPCRDGQVVIQDEGSQLVAELVGCGKRILDCCAAPGGKTWALADHNPDASIVAADLHAHRTRLMQQLVKAPNVQFITADATKSSVGGEFDRILVDVPCSGTGTLARNPDIKWRIKPSDLDDLHQRQVAILTAALDRLAPGGRLIYSTCSLEREENEDVVVEVLGATGKSVRVVPCAVELNRLKTEGELVWPEPDSLTRGVYLRTIPGIHPCDGFFAAIFEKT